MKKLRIVGAVLLAPLFVATGLLALPFVGVGGLLLVVLADKKTRKQIAFDHAVKAALKAVS